MSWLSSFLHPERGYENAQNTMNQYYQQGQNYQQPYNQFGQGQGANINEMIKNLMNPQALQDKWSKDYTESDAAKNMEGLATQHGLDAASSMGLMGSNTALDAIQSGTSGIAAQDRQNYMNDLMDKYKTAAGMSQNMYNTGAGTASQMGNNAMNMGQNSGALEYGRTNAPGNMFGQIGGGISKILADYMTGGMGKGSFGRGAWSTK